MAAGDVFIAYSAALADDGTLDAQPAGTAEATIHNIWAGGIAEVYCHSGANTVKIMDLPAAGTLQWLALHVTNSIYITIKNVNGDAQDVGYSGRYTHA